MSDSVLFVRPPSNSKNNLSFSQLFSEFLIMLQVLPVWKRLYHYFVTLILNVMTQGNTEIKQVFWAYSKLIDFTPTSDKVKKLVLNTLSQETGCAPDDLNHAKILQLIQKDNLNKDKKCRPVRNLTFLSKLVRTCPI